MLVSILINSYNYERYLRRAIDSALNQTYPQIEVIVVDDGSTDGSRRIIAEYGDRIIPVLKTNGGQSSAINSGFSVSRGEIICFLDADDEFLPGKVQRVVEEQRACPDSWCFHQTQFVDENSHPIVGSPVISAASGVFDLRSDFLNGTSTFWPPATSGLSFARRMLSTLLPMPENIRITSDNYLKFSAIALSPGVFIAEGLSLQRIHGQNAYTLNYDPALRAETNFVTGKAIRQRHPSLGKIGDRLAANGLGGKYRSQRKKDEVWQELIDYTSPLSLGEKTAVFARFFYCAFLKPNKVRSNTSLSRSAAVRANVDSSAVTMPASQTNR